MPDFISVNVFASSLVLAHADPVSSHVGMCHSAWPSIRMSLDKVFRHASTTSLVVLLRNTNPCGGARIAHS